MVRVKIVKLPDGVPEDDKYIKIGQVYEAFELRDEKCGDDFYKHFFALNLGWGIFHISPNNIEIIEDETVSTKVNEDDKLIVSKHKSQPRKVLIVEDGSVDVDHIENDLGIDCIIYRSGASKPEFLEY